ncbi:MAG TPA: site-2 protease family protein [Candidatus Baltobacteraceae bacterium]|nr:site-2 protease family protein [Candidatus Baltobacteraceae bacterium]
MTDPQPPPPRKARGLGTIAAALALAATKFKFLLIGLKFFTSSWTFLLSLAFYVVAFGWRIGIVLILVLAAHELGHYVAYRGYGLSAKLPVFIPFLGAYTVGAIAPDLEQDAYIALAGPLTGLTLAAACYAIAISTGDRFWFACADISAFLNLFNMIPVLPFDGGRVIGAVWPPLWIAGIVAFIAAAAWLGVPLVLVLLIALLGVPTMYATLRGRPDPRAASMTGAARIRVGIWYLATAISLAYVLGQAHAALPPNQVNL